jgi:uncharacterized membrane protein
MLDKTEKLGERAAERAADLTGQLAGRAQELGGQVAERAPEVTQQLVERAQEIGGQVAERAPEVTQQLIERAHELVALLAAMSKDLAKLTDEMVERSEGLADKLPMPVADSSHVNVGGTERVLSILGGVPLILYGFSRRSPAGLGLSLIGGDLLYRGVTGNCAIYQTLGIDHGATFQGAQTSVPYEQGIRVEESVVVSRPRSEVYAFWRNLEHLPDFMDHLESVKVVNDTRSHWVAKAPAGTQVEWDAEIINDEKNERIGWRSLPGSEIPNAGSVQFLKGPGGHGTRVKVELEYMPPAGPLGAAVAKLFGEEPSQQVRDDLQRLKALLENGAPKSGQK